MHYFTALGITIAFSGGLFLFLVLAIPAELIAIYFTPVVQVMAAVVIVAFYLVSLKWVKRNIRVV